MTRFYGTKLALEESVLKDSEGKVIPEIDSNKDATDVEDDRTLYTKIIDAVDTLEAYHDNYVMHDDLPDSKVIGRLHRVTGYDDSLSTWTLEEFEDQRKNLIKEINSSIKTALDKSRNLVKNLVNNFKKNFPSLKNDFKDLSKRTSQIQKRLDKREINQREIKVRNGSLLLVNGKCDPVQLMSNIDLYSKKYLEQPTFLNNLDDLLFKAQEVLKNTKSDSTVQEIIDQLAPVAKVKYDFPFSEVTSKDKFFKQFDFPLSDNVIVNAYSTNVDIGLFPKPPTVTLKLGEAIVDSLDKDQIQKVLDSVNQFAKNEIKYNEVIANLEKKIDTIFELTKSEPDEFQALSMEDYEPSEKRGFLRTTVKGGLWATGQLIKGVALIIRLLIAIVVLGTISILRLFFMPFFGLEDADVNKINEMSKEAKKTTVDKITDVFKDKLLSPDYYQRHLTKLTDDMVVRTNDYVSCTYQKSLKQIFKSINVVLDCCDKSLG